MHEQRRLIDSQRETDFDETKAQTFDQTYGWNNQDNCLLKDSYGS